MFTFEDLNGNRVDLFFHKKIYEITPKHILAIVKKRNEFLCTIHKERGIEFPGGKVEPGETLIDAVKREVLEETNVSITNILELGHYIVREEKPFCKAIFLASVEQENEEPVVLETLGRVWLTKEQLKNEQNLSFYMKDDGMRKILQEVETYEKQHDLFKA